MPGIATSIQIAFPPTRLNKLQSFLVAAEVACSRGDFPVVIVDTTLVAVAGLATAAVVAAVPAVLADAVLALPIAAKGAAHPISSKAQVRKLASPSARMQVRWKLLATTSNVKHSCRPRAIFNGFKSAVRS